MKTQEAQQYPLFDCKKVSKAKTTVLKIDTHSEHRDSFVKPTIKSSLQIKNVSSQQGFNYLDGQKTQDKSSEKSGSKSFEDILKESKKILQMKEKMEHDKRQRQVQTQKLEKQSKRHKKTSQNKKSKKKDKFSRVTEVEDGIELHDEDLKFFESQSEEKRKLREKFEFIQNISQKCGVLKSIFSKDKCQQNVAQNDPHEESPQLIQTYRKDWKKFQEAISLAENETQLMKKNLQYSTETMPVQLYSMDQINRISKQERKRMLKTKQELWKCEKRSKYVKKLSKKIKQMEKELQSDQLQVDESRRASS